MPLWKVYTDGTNPPKKVKGAIDYEVIEGRP